MKNKNILITGGRGFIGNHLAGILLKNNNVKIFDIKDGKDIRNLDLLKKEINEMDFVFHFAGLISVEESMKRPLEYINTNVIGSYNVLRAALDADVRKVIFSSSAAVYGDHPANPKKETMSLLPKSPYALSKVVVERFMEAFNNSGLNTVSLRFFNVYGSDQNINSSYVSVIPTFITKALKNEDLTIHGDGKQTRDFIYINDVINACILATEKGSGAFNIGTGIPTNINEISNLIIELAKSKSKIYYEKQREGDIVHSLSDISKARKIIGFKPKFDIATGLKRTIDWFRK